MTRSKAIDPLRTLPGYALKRVSSIAIDQLKQRMKAMALRPVDASVLLVIQANPGITQSTIARMLDIAAPNMATLTSRLLERGLVVRNDLDGRSHGIVLSAAGEALATKSYRIMKEHEETLMAQVPASLRRGFLASLQALLPAEPQRPVRKRRPPP
jgi:DNA-binding MarR family transcriptional regulator